MSIQKLFTSRVNDLNSTDFVGEETRLWYDPVSNSFYVSDGVTAGGIPVGTASTTGSPTGPTNSVQLNSGHNTFLGTANLEFANNTLAVVGNVTATNVTTTTIFTNTIVSNGTGNIYHTGNLLPSAVNYTLGTLDVPWGNAFFGPQSVTILDSTGNIGNAVTIENISANITLGTAGFNIVNLGTADSIFRIEALTGQIFSFAKTIIQNTTNAANTYDQGALQVKGGASVVKDFYVGGNIYGTGAQLSDVVNSITTGIGLTQTASVGNVGLDATGVQTVVGTANQINVTNVGQNLTLSLPQGINTNSTVTFANLTITGNLTVNGTTTTANSQALNGKILYLANTSTSNTQIDGGGIILGNAVSSYRRGILYSLTNNWWDTDGAGINTLALTAGDADIANLRASGAAHFGAAYEGYDYPDAIIQIDANVNTYSQIVFTNHSPGTGASSDYVAVNDIGTDSQNYIDFGINSSNYTNADYAVTGANDGYLYINGGNLAIGTQTAGQVVNFFTGGTNAVTNIRTILSDSELAMKNANVLVQDGSDNSVIELRTDGNIVFNGGSTLNLTGGFHVSSVSTNNGDANIVNYTGGAFVYGPALKDYAGNLKANIFTATGNITAQGNISGAYILGNGSGLTGVIHTLGNTFSTFSANGVSLVANTSSTTLTLTPGNNIVITGTALTNTARVAVADAPTFTGNVTANYFVGNGSILTSLTGANVTGTVANATYAVSAGTATTAAQPNITSVGTLTSLTSNGVVNFANTSNVTLGAVGNVHVTGGSANAVLITNGAGNLSFASLSSINGVGSNQLVYVLNAQQTIGSARNTLLSLFGLTNGVTLATNTRYQYEILFNSQCSKAGVLSYALALSGGAAVAQHNYTVISNKTTAIDTYTAGITMMSENAAGAAITTAQTVADTATFTHTVIQGTIDVTTGGNVNFMVSQDQNTPVTWTVNAGSYVKLLPLGAIGSNTVDGTWS